LSNEWNSDSGFFCRIKPWAIPSQFVLWMIQIYLPGRAGMVKKRHANLKYDKLGSEADHIVLRELGDAPFVPLGSWKMCTALEAAGIETSEATVGRLLRRLDMLGFTRSVANKGRILTEKGKRHLQTLEQDREHLVPQQNLLRVIRSERIEDLLDVLNARRIIETETARLAAIHATDSELRELEEAVRWHREYMLGTGGKVDQNIVIHRLVAQASRSQVLQALVTLLYKDREIIETHYKIQLLMGGRYPGEHDPLLQALVEREPDRAAEAMSAHLSYLIKVVQEYVRKVDSENPARPVQIQVPQGEEIQLRVVK
jgi:GntR family L-lactate dehydrogenase operon transcriptional regulator